MRISITLPIPPSVNNLYVNARPRASKGFAGKARIDAKDYAAAVASGKSSGGGRFKSKGYRNWIRAADAAYVMQRASMPKRPIEGEYGVCIVMPESKHDVDNNHKAILDWLVRVGLTPDDSHAQMVITRIDKQRASRDCEVIVWSIVGGEIPIPSLLDAAVFPATDQETAARLKAKARL